MVLTALTNEEIKEINEAKNKYVTIKYNIQDENFKNFLSDKDSIKSYNINHLKEEYLRDLNLNNGNINQNDYDDFKNVLDGAKNLIDNVKRSNQYIIDECSLILINNLKNGINKDASVEEKCKYIFEYVTKTFELYKSEIPFDDDYDTVFYRNVPRSNNEEGLIVTSIGKIGDLANLISIIGKTFDLDISVISCEYDNKVYYINALNIDGNVSYMDAASVIEKRKTIEEACLVSRDSIIKDGGYHGLKKEGITLNIPEVVSYNIDNVIANREKLFPDIEFVNEWKDRKVSSK